VKKRWESNIFGGIKDRELPQSEATIANATSGNRLEGILRVSL